MPLPSNAQTALDRIRHEMEEARDGNQYIENTTDAFRFLSHILWLLSDGKEGERSGADSMRGDKLIKPNA